MIISFVKYWQFLFSKGDCQKASLQSAVMDMEFKEDIKHNT